MHDSWFVPWLFYNVSVDQMSVDKRVFDQKSADLMYVDLMSVDQNVFDQMSVDPMYVDLLSIDQMVFDQMFY